MFISGPNIPLGSTILSVDSGTQLTISNNSTLTSANGTFQGYNGTVTNGGVGSGDVTLYSGTLNLQYDAPTNDTTRQKFWLGNNSTGNSLIVNGSSTVTVNRSVFSTAANKHLMFKDLTIGSSTLTVTASNTYVLEINAATNLTGNPLFNVGNTLLLNGAVSDGGSQRATIKGGGGDLWLNSTASSFGGLYAGTMGANGLGIVVNGGLLRFGDVNSDSTTVMNMGAILRNSSLRVNPTANFRLINNNIVFTSGQVEQLSVNPQFSVFRLATTAMAPSTIQAMFSSTSSGVVGLEGVTYATNLDLAAIGNGAYFLGANTTASTYSGTALTVGAGNIYRIGGGGSTLTLDAAGTTAGVLTGTASVLYGTQATNGNGIVFLSDVNNYTGATVVSRSTTVQYNAAATAANAHPLGNGQVDVFGTLEARTNGSFRNFAGTANQNTVVLHPGAVLFLNNNSTTQTFNRWDDATGINLNGAQLQINSLGSAPALTNVETIGAVTYQKGAIISVAATSGGSVGLTTGAFTRTGAATMKILTTTGTLGTGTLATANHSNLVVGVGAASVTPSGNVNTILPAYFVNGTDNTFVTYGANGFTNATYTNTFAGGVFSTNTTSTSIVDITTAPMVLTQDQTVYALRTAQNISSGVGQYNTITFADGTTDADRGGLIITGTPTVAVNLKFGNSGNKEGVIYNSGNSTVSGDIYAGSLVKFGAGTLTISKDQTAAANGTGFSGAWTVNEGGLTLNTFGASGDGGTITLNSSSSSTATGTTLNLLAQPGSSLNVQYTMGRIIAVDNAIITSTQNATATVADFAVGISDLEINSTDTTGLSPARLRINITNTRSVINAGTLFLTGTGNSIVDVNASAVNNQITSGATGSGLIVSGLNGSRDLIKWGNGVLAVGGNNSTSFTGNVYVEQGSLRVTSANAFGNAGTSITARRYGVIDIMTAGFTKAVTYEAGSIERWSVDNARSGTINLGGATLQVNADQNNTTATVQLNGGSIEGFLRTDDPSSANSGLFFRTLGANVSISLLGNSFLGQNAFTDGPNGTDNGKTADLTTGIGPDTNSNSELQSNARGAILEIKGNISGVGGLTKQSSDTVILSGTNTYLGTTSVADGNLRLGSGTALPTGGNVTTAGRGVLDLGGFNASLGNLTSAVISLPNTGSVFASTGGFITNSATVAATLTVAPTADGSYSGVIQNNINLVKNGGNKLLLRNANTFIGQTTVNNGILEVSHVLGTAGSGVIDGLSGTSKLTVANGATFNVLTGTIGGSLTLAGTSGTVLQLDAGSRLGLEVGANTGTNPGSGAGQNTGSSIVLNSGAKALVGGLVTVDAYFLPGIVTHAGKSDILVAPGGGLVSTNGSSGSYAVGNVYNVTNFTVTGITATDTLVQFDVATAAALTDAYWKGAYTGLNNVWAVSNGSTLSNWTTDLGGTTNTGLVPSSGTNVFLSASGQANQNNMLLGADMTIKSLTVNNSDTVAAPITLQSTGGYTLSIADAAAVTVDPLAAATTINSKISLLAATATVTVNAVAANPLTINGILNGTNLTKAGTGTLVLAGANTYTGATQINAGILSVAGNLALGTTGGATTVAADGSLELQGNVNIAGEALTLNGDGATVGADTSGGALRNLSGNNIFNGAIALATASTIQSDAGTLNINSGISATNLALTFEGAGNTVVNGVIATGSGAVIKNNAGVLTLANANTYTGATTINGGTLVATIIANGAAASSIGQSSNIAANLVFDGGTLQYVGGAASTDRLFTLAAGGGTLDASGTGALNLTNVAAVSFSGAATARSLTLTGSNTGANTLAAQIINNGAGLTSVTKSGAGTWVLSGSNTYTGVTTISGGVLSVGTLANGGTASGIGQATNATSNLVFSGGGTLQYTGASVTTNRGFTVTGGNTGVIEVTNSATRLTFSGDSAATNGNLQKTGSGSLTLTGTYAHTGTTTVTAGTLNGTGTLSSQLVVQSGATYSAGTDTDGTNNDGVGKMAVASADWQAGAKFVFDFGQTSTGVAGDNGTNWDLIQITGAGGLTLGAAAGIYTLNLTSWNLTTGVPGANNGANNFNKDAVPTITPDEPSPWPASYRWLWVDNTGGGAINVSDGVLDQFNVVASPGVFTPGPYGAPNTLGGHFWVSSFSNDLYINYSSVPEPGSLLLVGLAGLGFAGYRRRKRRQADAVIAAQLVADKSSDEAPGA